MRKATVRELEGLVKGRRVFLRADLNVPMGKDGSIDDDKRIVASIQTLEYLLDKGARVVMASHFGRPKSKDDKSLSLHPVFDRLQQLLPNVKMKIGSSIILVTAPINIVVIDTFGNP